MKTTLKYNTIETFQRQPAWKTFIDTIVDNCNGLYDDTLTAFAESDTDMMSEFTDFDDEHNNPKELGLYELINNRYILTADETRNQNKTYYKKATDNATEPLYSLFDYINTNTPSVLQENISLNGLLRTLSLYGCKIKDIELKDSVLPHTYKTKRNVEEVGYLWGFESGNIGEDYQAHAIVDNDEDQEIGVTIVGGGDLPDKYKYKYEYIEDIYGYNQKHPVISVCRVKEVKSYYRFVRKTESQYGHGDDTNIGILPACFYIGKDNMSSSSIEIYTDLIYKATHEDNSGIIRCSDNDFNYTIDPTTWVISVTPSGGTPTPLTEILSKCYNRSNSLISRWVYVDNIEETAFVLNDRAKGDLVIENSRVVYNESTATKYYENLSFSSSNEDEIKKVVFDGQSNTTIGRTNVEDWSTPDTKLYYIYDLTDSENERTDSQWVVMDEVEEYFNISLPYLKNQLFADESALKAQPLFLYENNNKVSMCGNLLESVGGVDDPSTADIEYDDYEIEKYNKSLLNTTYTATDNIGSSHAALNRITGISYGDYYYKWEQYNGNGTFNQDVYTVYDFSRLVNSETDKNSLSYFFNGEKLNWFIDQADESYTNNEEKLIDGYVFKNTHRHEFFETMYFNHFIKVYPIVEDKDMDYEYPVVTTKLYCDNLELVEFGDIVPYIVSYDRAGDIEEGTDDDVLYNDLDCSTFSRILSYNKRTHLIIVDGDAPVIFENINKPKYVVVAYQKASPFNKISDLYITAPNENIKELTKGILKNYINQNCNLWIKNDMGEGVGRNLLQYSDRILSNPNYTDNRNYINMWIRLVPSTESTSPNIELVANQEISSTGKKVYTFTISEDTHGYNCLWLRHSGGTSDYSIFFELYEKVSIGDTLTLSFEVEGCNPTVINGLMVKNFKLERGSAATDWSVAPEEIPYEQIKN